MKVHDCNNIVDIAQGVPLTFRHLLQYSVGFLHVLDLTGMLRHYN